MRDQAGPPVGRSGPPPGRGGARVVPRPDAGHPGRDRAAREARRRSRRSRRASPTSPSTISSAMEGGARRRRRAAAVLLEPIQGEGGVVRAVVGLPGRGARALCTSAGVLLIADEIQTGLGRTGRWFAFQAQDLQPDIVTMAKALGNGMPVGACWARAEVAAAFGPGDHGSTFGGQPLALSAVQGHPGGDGGRGRLRPGPPGRGPAGGRAWWRCPGCSRSGARGCCLAARLSGDDREGRGGPGARAGAARERGPAGRGAGGAAAARDRRRDRRGTGDPRPGAWPRRAAGEAARVRVTKHQRQHRITKILETQPVTNQAQLVELLAAEGIEATQTTVSRDLEELGAVKVRLPGGDTRVRPGRAPDPADRAERAPAPGARRVGGRDGLVGQPGRPADAAGVRARRGLGARPERPRRAVGDGGRRRYGATRGRRGAGRRRPWSSGSSA